MNNTNQNPQSIQGISVGAQTSVLAVIAATIGGVVSTVNAKGPYSIVSSIIGVLLLSILITYGLNLREKRGFVWAEDVTFGLVFGFCAFLFIAAFLEKNPPTEADTSIAQSLTFTCWLIFSVIGALLKFATRRSSRQTPNN